MSDVEVYRQRTEQVQEFLRARRIRFALLTPSPNFEYLTGIHYAMRERLIALVVMPDGPPVLVLPSFEQTNLSRMTWIEEVVPWSEDQDPYDLLAEIVSGSSGDTVALDDSLPLGVFRRFRDAVGGTLHEVSITPLLADMRLRKSEAELELMRQAGKVIAAAVERAFNEAHVGMSELELKRVVQDEIERRGAVPTFAAVQFGPNSALPHAEPGTTRLQTGDVVLLDCGCSYGGYNTDMTRVGVVGTPSEEQERIYSIVVRAQETAIEKIAPGLTCGSADGIARRVIEQEGLGEYFTHRLGHGIGLEVHEPPYLVRGNPMELESGMTHSVEPGIYLEGNFGIRIEDLVVVTDNGCELLTSSPKTLRIIEE